MAHPTDKKTYVTAKGITYVLVALACAVIPLTVAFDLAFVGFVIAFGVLWLVLNIYYPFAGLLFYSVFVLVRPNEFIDGFAFPFMEKAMVIPLLVVVVARLIKKNESKITITAVDRGVAFFVVIALLSVLTSVWYSNALDNWIDLFRLFIIYVLVASLIDTKKQFRVYVYTLILTTAFHAASATINYYLGVRQVTMGVERAMALDLSYGAPNSLAATIVYTIPFAYYYFKESKNDLNRAFLIILLALFGWCVMLTASRTGMLGVIFIVCLLTLEAKRRVLYFLVGGVALVGFWFVMPDQYQDRFASSADFTSGTGAARSASGRIDGLIDGIEMMIERPLLGVGVGQYSIALGMKTGEYWEAHSLIGQLVGDLGILGTIAFILWIMSLWKCLVWCKGAFADDPFMLSMTLALRVQLLSLLFMGFGGHNLYRFNWYFASAMVVILIRLAHQKRLNDVKEEAKSIVSA